MKRLVIKAIIRICAESILFTTVIGVVIGVLGHMNKWTSSITYSNAFFVAGCLLIIAGASSRYASGQGWNNFQFLRAESFRDMSSGEQAKFIVDSNSPVRLVILGVFSGVLLILISVFVTRIF